MKIRTRLVRTPQELERLQGFVKSFGQQINPALQSGIISKSEYSRDMDEVWIGCFQTINVPIVLVGLHPELSKGRPAVTAIEKLKAWSEVQFGCCYTGVTINSPLHPLMERLDFKNTNLQLFKSEG